VTETSTRRPGYLRLLFAGCAALGIGVAATLLVRLLAGHGLHDVVGATEVLSVVGILLGALMIVIALGWAGSRRQLP
jgi:hypothetical protein